MHRRNVSLRPLAPVLGPVLALALAVAACTSGAAEWTYQPTPVATPAPSGTAAAATGSPGGSPGASPAASPSGGPAGACSADATVIKIEETAQLKMVPANITVKKGAKVCFEVTNTAGFPHNFYVGPASDIEARNKTDQVAGTPDFSSGTQALEYTFSGSGPYEYACWIPGHLEAGMKGTVTLQ